MLYLSLLCLLVMLGGADHRFSWSVREGPQPAQFDENVGRAILPAAGF
jgi:hypothetical protein